MKFKWGAEIINRLSRYHSLPCFKERFTNGRCNQRLIVFRVETLSVSPRGLVPFVRRWTSPFVHSTTRGCVPVQALSPTDIST